jgi:hypothetical protein
LRLRTPQNRPVFQQRKAPAKGWRLMEITNSGAFLLVPVVLSVAFLLWVLWGFWKDAHR